MERTSEKLTVVLLAFSVAVLLAFSAAAYVTVSSFQSARVEVLQARQTLSDIVEIESLLRRAVSEMRGYVITGQEDYLAELPDAEAGVRTRLKRLGALSEPDDAQRDGVKRLSDLAERRIDGLEEVLRLRRTEGKEQAEGHVSQGEGKRLDREIVRAVRDLEARESQDVARRLALVDQHARRTFVLLGAAIGANVVLVGAVFLVLRRESRVREHTTGRLKSEADRAQSLFEQAQAASAELRRSQQLFQRLFENSPDAMVLVDAERRIVRANARAHALFGWAPETLKSALLDELLPQRFRARHLAHMAAYFRDPKARPMGQGLELFGLRTDGAEFPVDIMLSPMDLDGGLQVLAVIRDITQRKQAQQHIERLNEDLQRRAADLEYANKELEAFSYSVSHDLRAPLRHINGFADMLRSHASGMLDDKGRRYLDTIVDAAKRMGMLIDDLLLFSRMGRTEMVRQPVDLATVAEEVKRAAERESAGPKIDWRISPLPEVQGDVAMLRQVLFNLVSNAVKYSRGRPEAVIEIGTAPSEPGEVVCFVKDNGAGFDMKYAHKLFGVFQRLHGPAEFEGTGVGLAIVRRIVQRHGGRVWAEAAVEQGATFFFSLPVKAP